jgi:hypothetical protein
MMVFFFILSGVELVGGEHARSQTIVPREFYRGAVPAAVRRAETNLAFDGIERALVA